MHHRRFYYTRFPEEQHFVVPRVAEIRLHPRALRRQGEPIFFRRCQWV